LTLATVTVAPPRTRVSTIVDVSISSEPSATGTRTLIEEEDIFIRSFDIFLVFKGNLLRCKSDNDDEKDKRNVMNTKIRCMEGIESLPQAEMS